MANREGREAIISVRLSPREEEQIKEAAEKRGEPVSAFVREAALRVAGPTVTGYWSTSPATVAPTGTVIPDMSGAVSVSSPAPARLPGTAGIAPEPITRSR